MPMNFWVRVFWNVSTEAAMNICLSESDSGAFGRRLWLPRSWRTEDGLRQTGTLNNNTCLSFRRFNHSNFIAPVSTRNVSEFWSQDWVSSIGISVWCYQLRSVFVYDYLMLLTSESAANWIGTFSGQMSDGCTSFSIISTSQIIRWAFN